MKRDPLVISASVERGGFSASIDLEVSPGRPLGLTGPIGAGKSTVLALVAGSLQVSDGLIALGDEVWDQPATATVVDRPVSLLSQNFWLDLPEQLTGTQVVEQSLMGSGSSQAKREAVARTLLAELGVGDHVVDRVPETFSGAEAQRVALAKAIAPRPAVLLLDEPFGALDKRSRATMREWLVQWLADFDGIAIIASTNVAELEALTDRVHTI